MNSLDTRPTVIIPRGKTLAAGLAAIDRLEANTPKHTVSDPFLFDRMRTHFRVGILDLKDIPGGSNE